MYRIEKGSFGIPALTLWSSGEGRSRMRWHLPGWSFCGITPNGLLWRRGNGGDGKGPATRYEATSVPRYSSITVACSRVRRFHVPPYGYERNRTRDKPPAKVEPNAVQHKFRRRTIRMQGQFPLKRRKIQRRDPRHRKLRMRQPHRGLKKQEQWAWARVRTESPEMGKKTNNRQAQRHESTQCP